MSYRNMQSDIESAFADSEWTSHSINTVPSNFQGEVSGEFVRVNVIPGLSANFFNLVATNGVARIDVFVESGSGLTRAMEICDLLNDSLQNKTFSNGTQTFSSTTTLQGVDPENAGYYRVNYTVPFRYYS